MEKISIVSEETMNKIIEDKSVSGLFLALETDADGEPLLVAYDASSDHDRWAESFRSLKDACRWLRGEEEKTGSSEESEADTGTIIQPGDLEKVNGWLRQMDAAASDAKTPSALRLANMYSADAIRSALAALGLSATPRPAAAEAKGAGR